MAPLEHPERQGPTVRMRLLITGPSCSGKTHFAHNWSEREVVRLDHYGSVREIGHLKTQRNVIFEGILSGEDSEVVDFLSTLDCVILLRASMHQRLKRTVKARWVWRAASLPPK